MNKWFEDTTVPNEQKIQFEPIHNNLLRSISFLWDLARKAGIAEEDIKKYLNVPF
jgi:hypothetical protein